jgi:xylulokinase
VDTVLGIDVGTQSVKVLFYDFESRRIAAAGNAGLQLDRSGDGAAEQEAGWWIDALSEALRGVDAGVRASACALAVSGQQHGFVPVDAAGDVVAPVKLWCDTSTADECAAIMEDYGGADACLRELGNLLLPGYTAPKIRWLRDAKPDAYRCMTRIMLPHDYVNFWLTGEHCMEAGDASGTGMLSVADREWSARMLRAIDPDRDLAECLPDIRLGNEAIGRLRDTAAERLGLTAGIPVAIGGGDNMMGAIGTGNVSQGTVTISLGTSGTAYACADAPVIDPEGEVAAFCSSTGGWLPLLCTLNCTAGTELIRAFLGVDLAAFEARLEAAERGAEGIAVVPFFAGERTPNLPGARGGILGIDTGNLTEENLARAVVEGVTYGLRHGVERLSELGIEADRIVLTGGGARSAAWRQIVADVCARPVVVHAGDEGAAFGAALQACALLQGCADIETVTRAHLQVDESRSCEPTADGVRFYDEAYRQYRRSVDAVAALSA